jgi:hypothetical protein
MGVAGLVLAVGCVWAGCATLLQGRHRWWQTIIPVVAVIGVLAFQATDPVGHLDNRYTGWVSE